MDRQQPERRQPSQSLSNIVGKLRMFQGLSPSESTIVLKACDYKAYEPKEVIYQAGDPGKEMLILLQGQLRVLGEAGTELGVIASGACCGEMGLFTGQPRSATIVSEGKSSGFVITRSQLDGALRMAPETHVKILQNIIAMISERLAGADMQIESYAGRLQKAEDKRGMIGGA